MFLGGFSAALKTLTILPFPGTGTERIAGALYFFPVVGALLGAALACLAWLLGQGCGWSAGAGLAGVIFLCWVTGGLHLDGLGDVADAYAPGRTRPHMLAIMKDHHVGAFGVTAIVLALLVKMAALAHLALGARWFWIPLPCLLSRLVMVLLCVALPYARPEGGTGKILVESARPVHLIAAGLVALALCLCLAGVAGGAACLLALLLGSGLAGWMRRVFGGVTGDLLGLANEIIECVLFFGLAAEWPFFN